MIGGMKRKLCVAIALIGDPEVVLLDEPSAGLDPVSRRNLWSVILNTMAERSVILTTHSMEECDALCRRVGIMVQGQIKALGTKQHLLQRYSYGYEVVIKLKVKDDVNHQTEVLTGFVTGIFPSTTIISQDGGLVTYRVIKEEMDIATAFTQLETNKVKYDIETYSSKLFSV